MVWVEDLERFARGGGAWDDAEPETPEESERLNPIRALLLGLERLESVSVITATTTLYSRFDIEKIARYVEELPSLPAGHVSQIFKTFRNGCLSASDIRDTADPVVRKELEELGQVELEEEARRMLGSRIVSLASAIVHLCTTPRTLKSAIRTTLDTWRRLLGEIDFDDLLVMSIVRAARPDVFAAIAAHVDALRRQAGNMRSELLAKEQEQAWKAWQETLQNLRLDDAERAALNVIIEFVFKKFSPTAKPQGLRHDTHANYWQRFLAVPEIPDAHRDQAALQAIVGFDDVELIAWLEDPQRHRIIESFGHHIETERLLRLLDLLVSRRTPENPSDWPDYGRQPPGLVPLWRLWNRSCERGDLDPEVALTTIQRAYDHCVGLNLALVAPLEYYFVAATGPNVPNILGRDGDRRRNEQAKQYLRRLLAETFRGRSAALAAALRGTAWWTLRSIVFPERREEILGAAPFPEWSALSDTLLDAAREHPDAVLLQLAGLMIVETPSARPWEGPALRFEPKLAETLFGAVDRVLGIYRTTPDGSWKETPPGMAMFEASQAEGTGHVRAPAGDAA